MDTAGNDYDGFWGVSMERDEALIARALLMWRNYIQTGNVVLSHNDAVNSKQSHLLRQLSREQVDLVLKLEKLSGFYQEMQNQPPRHNPLLEYAERYLEECEAYDKTVCTLRSDDGAAVPANSREWLTISKHADLVKERLTEELVENGLVGSDKAAQELQFVIYTLCSRRGRAC